jgi:hypothetical protein
MTTRSGNQRQFLIDRGNPRLLRLTRGSQVNLAPLPADGAAVAAVDAGQNLDQGRFARAVLAHDRMHLARQDGQAAVRQGRDAAEGLGDAGHLQKRFGHGQGPQIGWVGAAWARPPLAAQ